MTGGYVGKLLWVDLTSGETVVKDLSPELSKKFIGGAGYAAKIIYDAVNPKVDPLGPDNLLVFMAGPMVGTTFPGGTKWTVCSRSPQTYIWGEASASGFFGAQMKRGGFDGIVFRGKAKEPVYLLADEGKAEVKSANHLWGKDTIETANIIQSDLGERKARVACIGPAGERLVRFAAIVTDEERVAARSGMGTVMGSKNLKAVAVKGDQRVHVADEGKFRKIVEEVREAVKPPKAPTYTVSRIEGLTADGTARAVEGLEKSGALPTKNWMRGAFPNAYKISGTTMSKTILSKRAMCALCGIITCWRIVDLGTSPYAPLKGHGPEYETIASLGSLCMNENLEAIAKANDLCNRFGIDTISTGGVIAFAMECYEKGILSEDDTGGIHLTWGDPNLIINLVELIGRREGFGALLGEGVRRAAEKIGKGAENYAIHVKGLEFPMHEPRRWWTMALAYATSNRGACHLQGIPAYLEWGLLQPEFGFHQQLPPFVEEGKAEAVKFHQDFSAAFTSMGHCQFTIGGVIPFKLVAQAFSAITGRDIDHLGLLKCGERIWNVKRAFNVRMGVSTKDDTLPKRFLEEPLSEGATAGKLPPFKSMLERYYSLRGWKEGKPTRDKLEELGLHEIVKDLWP